MALEASFAIKYVLLSFVVPPHANISEKSNGMYFRKVKLKLVPKSIGPIYIRLSVIESQISNAPGWCSMLIKVEAFRGCQNKNSSSL